MKVTQYHNGPYDGVSQAPPQVALKSACSAMLNCWPVIPHGLLPRPPFEYGSEVDLGAAEPDVHALLHLIPRGSPEDDLMLHIGEATLGGFKASLFQNATKAPVAMTTTAAAQAYLDSATRVASKAFRAATIEDTTFVWSRDKTVAISADTAPARPKEALIWVKTEGYSRTYRLTITINGHTHVSSYQTATGGNSAHARGVATDRVARGLYDGTNPGADSDVDYGTYFLIDLVADEGMTVTLIGSVIYLSHPTLDFTIQCDDDAAGTAMVAIKTEVQAFSELPKQAANGFTTRVSSKIVGSASDYYVQFQATNTANSGTWVEVIQPGSLLGLDNETMPLGIKLVASVWTLDVLPWRERIVGNPELSTDPDLVGQNVEQITWVNGRLAIVGANTVILAAADDPFKLYSTTLATALESDPVGLLSAATSKKFFRDAVGFGKDLILFANGSQQRISTDTGGPVTAKTTGNNNLASTPFSDLVRVQGDVNGKAYYTALRDDNVMVYEAGLDRVSGEIVPEDMTSAVPTYLPDTVDRVATLRTDWTTLYGTSGSRDIFVHTFRYANNERVQNAWHQWQLPPGWALIDFLFPESATRLEVLAIEGSTQSTHWLYMDLAPRKLDVAPAVLLQFLDLKVSSAACSGIIPEGGGSEFTLPWTAGDDLLVTASVKAGVDDYSEGHTFTPMSDSAGADLLFSQDLTAVPMWFGLTYESSFVPNEWFYRDPKDETPRMDGRFSLTRLRLDLASFSHLRVQVSVKGRDMREYIFEGYNADDPETPLDLPPRQPTAALQCSLGGNSKDVSVQIINDSHLGFAVVGYEVLGDFNPQARRS